MTTRSPIVYSTEARGLSGRSALTLREQAEEADIKAVVLAQPHRCGDDSQQAGSSVGRLCLRRHWDKACFEAGLCYAADVFRFKAAMGLPIHFLTRSSWAPAGQDGNVEFYRLKLDAANVKLRQIASFLPGVMVEICYLDGEPVWSNVGFIGAGLAVLAVHYRLRKATLYDQRTGFCRGV